MDWIAVVEWPQDEPLDADGLDRVMDGLEGHAPAIGQDPLDSTVWSATVAVEANSLRLATAEALISVETATGRKATGVEVLPVERFDARAEQPYVPKLVGTAEIAELFDISRARVSQLRTQTGFPPPVAELRAGPVWAKSQVELWGSKWVRRSGPKSTEFKDT